MGNFSYKLKFSSLVILVFQLLVMPFAMADTGDAVAIAELSSSNQTSPKLLTHKKHPKTAQSKSVATLAPGMHYEKLSDVEQVEQKLKGLSCNGVDGSCPYSPDLLQMTLLSTSQFGSVTLADVKMEDGNVYTLKPGIELFGYRLKQINLNTLYFTKVGKCCGRCCDYKLERNFRRPVAELVAPASNNTPKVSGQRMVPPPVMSELTMVPPIMPNAPK